MRARHSAPRTRQPRAPYVVVAVVCTAMGALAVAAVKPPYVDRPFAVVTTVTVLKPSVTTVMSSPTPAPTVTSLVPGPTVRRTVTAPATTRTVTTTTTATATVTVTPEVAP